MTSNMRKFEQLYALCHVFGFRLDAEDVHKLGQSFAGMPYIKKQRKLFSAIRRAYILQDNEEFGYALSARRNGVSLFYCYQVQSGELQC